jgi:hypothetical protein
MGSQLSCTRSDDSRARSGNSSAPNSRVVRHRQAAITNGRAAVPRTQQSGSQSQPVTNSDGTPSQNSPPVSGAAAPDDLLITPAPNTETFGLDFVNQSTPLAEQSSQPKNPLQTVNSAPATTSAETRSCTSQSKYYITYA